MIWEDVTASKRAEQMLQRREERWRSALENADQGVWKWNMKTSEMYYSPRYKQILGYAQDQMADILEEWGDRVHPDGREPGYDLAYRLRAKAGSVTYFLNRR